MRLQRQAVREPAQASNGVSALDDQPEPGEDETYVDPSQISFFEDDEHAHWQQHWQSMPEFVQKDLSPIQSLLVHFETLSDLAEFAKLVEPGVNNYGMILQQLDANGIWRTPGEIVPHSVSAQAPRAQEPVEPPREIEYQPYVWTPAGEQLTIEEQLPLFQIA